ncbi:MAG: hypothetical protein DMG92_00750 [Acidobacteria bacterium]|nr:MAG: hypothetical protein DMG92_00750 [Acidobacteriota bacterium]
MRINGVDLPARLLEAQRDGSLVVFAGAGVSMPAPSSLPNFGDLAEQVGGGVLARQEGELVDRFLGRLKDRNVDVHERVRRILSIPGSQPNPLHTDLLKLFDSVSTVRLVTTNFDEHFTSASRSVFSGTPGLEIYSAPALPLGGAFLGIVHIHGSIGKPASRMVLTDSDFGAAYLIDGWATRFLQQLFANYVVMFIGYSHNDVVVDYLARGLPPKSKGPGRFAIAIRDTEALWSRLGITPVIYSAGSGDQRHSAVGTALKGWVALISTPALDHEEKIKTIVERPVPLDREQLDYIEHACKQKSLVQFFVRHAQSPDWLRWAESRNLLSNLFRITDLPAGEIDQHFASWFARHFIQKHSDDALAVLQRQGGTIAPFLWYQIAQSFHQLKPSSNVISKWIPVLVDLQPRYGSKDLLAYRLCDCEFPRDEATIFVLLEHLTRPRLVLKKKISFGEDVEAAEATFETEGSEHWLKVAWDKLLQPNLKIMVGRHLIMITSHIQHTYYLIRGFQKEYSSWDPLSGSRGQIAISEAAPRDDGTGFLIDIARDTLNWATKHEPTRSDFFIDLWSSSDLRLLRRLSIYAVSESPHWTPDAKMNWLLEKSFLHTYGYKPEVFLVLERAYATASDEARNRILDRAVIGSNQLEGRTKEYEIFNLLYWLTQMAPECTDTSKRFDELKRLHPEFGPREYPNLDWWIGPVGWAGPISPLRPEEVLSASPEQLLEKIEAAKPGDFGGPSRTGLLYEVTQVVTQNFDWSIHVAEVLQQKHVWDADIWGAVITGWQNSTVSEEHWTKILKTLLEIEEAIPSVLYEACRLLELGINKSSHSIPISQFDLAIGTALKLWDASTRCSEQAREAAGDWLQLAINHPAGSLLSFWLHALSRVRAAAGEEWNGMPQEHQNFLTSVVTGHSYAAAVGRVLIASQTYFLFSTDRGWTLRYVLPLFSFSKDHLTAIQAWHGFLGWGSWTEALLPDLMPRFEETFPKLHTEFGSEQRESFCGFLAGIA